MNLTRRTVVGGAVGLGITGCASAGGSAADPRDEAGSDAAYSADGFELPDEGGPHERTFMQWPSNRTVYPDRGHLEDVQAAVAVIANTISEFEPVVMLMDGSLAATYSRHFAGGVEIWAVPTDDLWARDSGPLFVRNAAGQLAVRSLNFNGWGNKQAHSADARVAAAVAARLGIPLLNNGLVGEPGGVERSRDGVVMANRSSWLNPNRNRDSDTAGGADRVTALLLEAVGGHRMIWSDGVSGLDITDDHIDATARFVSDRDIVIQLPGGEPPATPSSDDPFVASAHRIYQLLAASANLAGEPYRTHVITQPHSPRVRDDDFLASYVNYYLCAGAVIMAEFGDDDSDEAAQATMATLYADREIVALNIDEIAWLGGGVHCATQQQPTSTVQRT